MKHPEEPERFADSEVDLHGEIERLRVLAGAPELYPDLVALNADVLGDHDDPAGALVAALVDNNALELLVQNLARDLPPPPQRNRGSGRPKTDPIPLFVSARARARGTSIGEAEAEEPCADGGDDDEGAHLGEDSAAFDLGKQRLASWAYFAAILGAVLFGLTDCRNSAVRLSRSDPGQSVRQNRK